MARIGKNQFIKLQARYKTDQAIAGLYGISRQAVHQLRNRYGITPVADKYLDRDREIVLAYQKGIPGTKLARKFKLSVSQTYRILGLAGIICSQRPSGQSNKNEKQNRNISE